jgi:hypothetical protein
MNMRVSASITDGERETYGPYVKAVTNSFRSSLIVEGKLLRMVVV